MILKYLDDITKAFEVKLNEFKSNKSTLEELQASFTLVREKLIEAARGKDPLTRPYWEKIWACYNKVTQACALLPDVDAVLDIKRKNEKNQQLFLLKQVQKVVTQIRFSQPSAASVIFILDQFCFIFPAIHKMSIRDFKNLEPLMRQLKNHIYQYKGKWPDADAIIRVLTNLSQIEKYKTPMFVLRYIHKARFPADILTRLESVQQTCVEKVIMHLEPLLKLSEKKHDKLSRQVGYYAEVLRLFIQVKQHSKYEEWLSQVQSNTAAFESGMQERIQQTVAIKPKGFDETSEELFETWSQCRNMLDIKNILMQGGWGTLDETFLKSFAPDEEVQIYWNERREQTGCSTKSQMSASAKPFVPTDFTDSFYPGVIPGYYPFFSGPFHPAFLETQPVPADYCYVSGGTVYFSCQS